MGSVAERLENYHSFTDNIIDRVGATAEEQASLSFDAFCELRSVPDPEILSTGNFKPQQILDFKPKDYDSAKANVLHLTMGNTITPNTITRAATLHALLPEERLIVIGNPSLANKLGRLSALQCLEVLRKRDLATVVEPLLRYLEEQDVTETTQLGYSYGADKAAVAFRDSDRFNQFVSGAVLFDPAAVLDRTDVALLRAFGSTNKHLDKYVKACNWPAQQEARDRDIPDSQYKRGLVLLSNIAIGHSLTTSDFKENVAIGLSTQKDSKASIIWGSDSELAINETMIELVHDLSIMYPARVNADRVLGQTHCMGNDIYLFAALMLQGLAKVAPM